MTGVMEHTQAGVNRMHPRRYKRSAPHTAHDASPVRYHKSAAFSTSSARSLM
jgi:hypothetical protein